LSRIGVSCFAILATATVAACGPSEDDAADELASLICGLRTDAVAGTFHPGAPPSAGNGPRPTVSSPAVVINGGTAMATVAGSDDFSRVVVGVAGAQGYYDVALPSATRTVDLQLTLCQALAMRTLDLQYAVGSSAGVGAYAEQPAAIVAVGTGELQVSVSWDAESDVDLHVVDPAGDEVFWHNDKVPSGGMLDLDSNADCDIDHVKNENITWAVAPPGTYTVRLDYFESCAVSATSYVVTVQRKGQPVQTFTGHFTGDGDLGGSGSGVTVTTFTVP